MMHPFYLPFTEQQVESHFAEVKKGREPVSSAKKHLDYFKASLKNYKNCPEGRGQKRPLSETKKPCQVEKDEKFWTAACLMTVFHSKTQTDELIKLFRKAYGDVPPLAEFGSWEECVNGELHLFFEANLPSPKSYTKWLRENLEKRQFIPYILDSDNGRKNLEGPTNVDAILLNSDNGFAVIAEAKVLSDISYQVTYDVTRNQIARNVDVMLKKNSDLCSPLDKREPEKTLFLLLTPRTFQNDPSSRLFGYKFNEYKNSPESLGQDLPHRADRDWTELSKRLGWLTWEDFRDVNPACCKWLD
jgi:hypothetical protein